MVTLIGGIIGLFAIALGGALMFSWLRELYKEVCNAFEVKNQIIDAEYYEIEED